MKNAYICADTNKMFEQFYKHNKNKTNKMKTEFLRYGTALSGALLCSMLMFTACDDKDKDDNQSGSEVGDMSANEQKSKLDKAGQALADELNVADLRYLSRLSGHIEETLADYESSAVTNWFETLIEGMTTVGETTTSYETGYWGYGRDEITSYSTRINQFLVLSNFTGHFTATAGKWNYEKASDLQFNFKDQEDKSCVLTLQTTGKNKEIALDEQIQRDYDWNYRDSVVVNENGYNGYYTIYQTTEYIDTIAMTISLPEKVSLTLTQEGKIKAELKLTTDLSGMSDDFNPNKDVVKASASLLVENYIFTESFNYDANKNAQYNFQANKENKNLLSINAKVEGNYSQELLKTVNLNIDLMDQVQIKGEIKDGNSFVKYIELANNNRRNESKFKANISLADELMDLGIYYDHKNARQAKVSLESFRELEYDYDKGGYVNVWECEPVFVFGDGTTHSTFGAFFESGFEKTIAKFEKILSDLNDL